MTALGTPITILLGFPIFVFIAITAKQYINQVKNSRGIDDSIQIKQKINWTLPAINAGVSLVVLLLLSLLN